MSVLYINNWVVNLTGDVAVDAPTEALEQRVQAELAQAVQAISARIATWPEAAPYPEAGFQLWVEE